MERTPKLAYTVLEAANLLSVSRSTMYELIRLRKIETIKIGNARRITAAQISTFIKNLEDH